MGDARYSNRAMQSRSADLHDDDLLEAALRDSDGLLHESLRVDERRRRRRRMLVSLLVIGAIAMVTTLSVFVAGWLSVGAPPPATQVDDEVAAIERAEELATAGWQLWQQQKFGEAAENFEQAVKLDPDAANAWNGLGWARFNSGGREGAIDAFEKCVELEPEHPAALNGLGQVFLAEGDLEKAKAFLEKAAPQAPAAQYGLARVYLLTGEYESAEKVARKLLRQQPDDPLLKQMLVAARKEELSDQLRKQIGPAPVAAADGSELAQRGWQYFNQGKARTAARLFAKALAEDPQDLSALNGMGFSLLNSGKAAQAKEYFEKCLALDADAAGPMNGLARCLKAEEKVDEAIALWEKMAEKYPGPTAAAVGLATTYLERGEFAKSAKWYEVLAKAQPDNDEWQNGLKAAREGMAKANPQATTRE